VTQHINIMKHVPDRRVARLSEMDPVHDDIIPNNNDTYNTLQLTTTTQHGEVIYVFAAYQV
jgi:hypothetical protein